MGFEDLHLAAPVAAALEDLGWRADDALARDIAPTAARGHNLVVIAPPAPAYGGPALAGLSSRDREAGPLLVLAPAAQLAEWGGLARRLAAGTRRIEVAQGTGRALRQLRADQVDLLVTTPETALALHRRSALKPERLAAVLIAWPETWESEESLATVMADLPREAQRVIYSADAGRAAPLVERYARKALTVGTPPAETEPLPPVGPVRTAGVSWSGRVAALADLAELLDPAELTIWAADRSHAEEIARVLPLGHGVELVTGDVPSRGTVIAFDPPSPERLRQLLEADELVVLAPPDTAGYLGRIAAPIRPLRLPGLVDTLTEAGGARRAAIVRALEEGVPDQAVLTLAPLFERYDPAAVAGALFQLWTSSAQLPGTLPDIPATARIYVGVGKKEGATANDLVAVLTKELRVDRREIGRIELRESYSLVELPARDAERIASALNGVTIRQRRVTARVDRGPSGSGGSGGSGPANRRGPGRGAPPRGPRGPGGPRRG